MAGIKVPMKFIGSSSTYFLYYTEHGETASLLYLGYWSPKTGDVCPPEHMHQFENLSSKHIFNIDYIIHFNAITIQKCFCKVIFLSACLPQKYSSPLSIMVLFNGLEHSDYGSKGLSWRLQQQIKHFSCHQLCWKFLVSLHFSFHRSSKQQLFEDAGHACNRDIHVDITHVKCKLRYRLCRCKLGLET